jgi:8-hydroxy-5-deazaflavin:NADPH oxidoreductase
MVTIAVIGAGNVGATLGAAFAKHGHAVRYGVRDPNAARYRELANKTNATVQSVTEAAAPAEVVILATPWPATEAALKSAGDLSGKILIDCTNPIARRGDALTLALGYDDSAGEAVARCAKGASVFKAFNQTGYETMKDPSAFELKPVMFVAGDDATKKPLVLDLVQSIGFEAIDFGGLEGARLLEPMAFSGGISRSRYRVENGNDPPREGAIDPDRFFRPLLAAKPPALPVALRCV